MRKILAIGISDNNPEDLNRKIRLHNLIVLFIILVCLGYMPLYIHYELFLLVQMNLILIFVGLFCLVLQFYKKYLLGFSILIFSVMALINITCLHFGLAVNMHYFHICSCTVAITLFDRNRILKGIVIGLALLSFFGLLEYLQYNPALFGFSEEMIIGLKIYGYFNYLVLFIFTIIFFTSFIKQNHVFQEKILKQNVILRNNNDQITKSSQITDSIKYARHIQDSILPPLEMIKKHLQESFILYKPKDIVAGDFYWFEAKENQILFAAADSTGHGVPGAMVSVICTNALNLAVKEFGLKEPGLILDKVRELISNSFHKYADDGVKDGMDISLCLIDTDKRTLKWAGANNPLWIIKNDSTELTVIKPNKQSVSKTEAPKPYTTHSLQLNEGDCFYLFTDGYADQFGGMSGKKHMQKRIKELLLSICNKTMENQKKLLYDNLINWMKNVEQVDDICFIGVRL